MSDQVPTSVEVLRQQARDELAAVIEHRCRAGEDPWQFIPDLPSVDEQVVIDLRASAIEQFDLADEQSRAHHPAAGRATFARFEYDVLRRIALEHPELSGAVWLMLDRTERVDRRERHGSAERRDRAEGRGSMEQRDRTEGRGRGDSAAL